MIESIDFYYFSGTGNTLLVVKKMKEIFQRKQVNVTLYRMEKINPEKINVDHMIGLGFPVAEQGTYPFIWDFVESLPPGNETPVFMVDTLMAYSGGIVGPLKKILTEKGYNTIGAREIKMPNNLVPKNINEEKNRKKIDKGLGIAEDFALSLINGDSSWTRIPGGSDLMAIPSKRKGVWKVLRNFYRLSVDQKSCNNCGLCFRLCPVGNIKNTDDGPVIGDNCYLCMRCFSFCPPHAIKTRRGERNQYRAVKAKDLLCLQSF